MRTPPWPLLLLAIILASPPGWGALPGEPHGAEVRFPAQTEPGDRRLQFARTLLAEVLRHADGDWTLLVVDGMKQPRSLQALRDGHVDVVVLPHLMDGQAGVVAVRQPLRRGLLGLRLLVARPETADRLRQVTRISELTRGFRLGYGDTWMDRDALAGLGFPLVSGSSYRGLFDMLRAGRFDYLSRGVNEVGNELTDPEKGHDLVVVPEIALYYPLDDYFFVSARRPALSAAIAQGFDRILANGRYAELFHAAFDDALRQFRIDQRRILRIEGYPIPPGTRLDHFDMLGAVPLP